MSSDYLRFFVNCFTVLRMWPKNTSKRCKFEEYHVTFVITVTTLPILADIVAQFNQENVSLTNVSENLVALSALLSVTYVSTCFNFQKSNIRALIKDLSKFENYSPKNLLDKTEQSIDFYTKMFIIYGMIGNVCYGLLPILDYSECEENRPDYMIEFGIPCGLVIRFLMPYKFDYSPLFEFMALYEIIICILCSTIIIIISMLICGILLHVTTQLRYLKKLIAELSNIEDSSDLEKQVKFCVKFHSAIIDYAKRTDLAFGHTMLLHITWTGFIISVLGFEITTTSNYVEAVRFFMHLLGWLGMLFLVCFYGQNLMDQSLAIADATYSFCWYRKTTQVQKYLVPIILRSQKPLTLRASGLKVMSLATFLGVLYSAYSYFTLLLKLK